VLAPDERCQLVERLRQRDEAAFGQVYQLYRARLYTFLLRLTRRESLARDLSQETWLRLAANVERLAPDSDPGAWLFTVARNLFISHRRWRILDRERLLQWGRAAPSHAVLPSEQAQASETLAQLERAVQALPLGMREVILLVAIEGFSSQEVARMLDVEDATVRQRLARARAQLERALSPEREP
jgi:RNA polymerase sigma-70 factor (ECF subfamily)